MLASEMVARLKQLVREHGDYEIDLIIDDKCAPPHTIWFDENEQQINIEHDCKRFYGQ